MILNQCEKIKDDSAQQDRGAVRINRYTTHHKDIETEIKRETTATIETEINCCVRERRQRQQRLRKGKGFNNNRDSDSYNSTTTIGGGGRGGNGEEMNIITNTIKIQK